MKSLLHFIIRCICIWVIIWSAAVFGLSYFYSYNFDDSAWRFIFGTLLPWIAVCFVARRYLDDKRAEEPSISLIGCRTYKSGDDFKIDIIVLNNCNAHINVIDWAYYIEDKKHIADGSDADVPRHKGIHRFTDTLKFWQGTSPPEVKKLKVWIGQQRKPIVFLPPFDRFEE